ncbi:lytic transglycosylase domain-containing protein [Pararhizobium sp.]|uniref:lytic transglycosylase domain-containing protein n=1 Tax=Pararhizobium sp. TaxID=1977563 RepID=UPI0027238145|nr:lytic transglycosylase domain-containing protein [Pararhizobium sp.]MDO9414575.1 lytic transglycosylase domain-containing protein [Pararhizobium sp.]
MRTALIAAVAACLCMSFVGVETSFAKETTKDVSRKQTKELPRKQTFLFQPKTDKEPAKIIKPLKTVKRSSGYAAPALRSGYTGLITSYASAYGVPVDLAHAVIRVESNFNAKARGSAGEIGLMQIKPATARMMGYSGSSKGLYDPETNIKFGMKYLAGAHKLSGGTTCGTILRYNAGHGARRMNPLSKRYCGKVQGFIN